MQRKIKLILTLIVFLGGMLRLYGVNWDQGHHLHPDERFLTMVATAIKIPAALGDYLNPQVSTMSPYNNNYGFFVYGTLPLNLVKILGEWTKQNTYDTIHLLGRQASAIFDVGVVLLVFLIGRKLWSEKAGLWSAFLYSIMVLPIQLSHFFAVDTFLNFFIVLSFYFLVLLMSQYRVTAVSQYRSIPVSILLGLSFGFALACKISALYFIPIIALGFIYLFIIAIKAKTVRRLAIQASLFAIFTLIAFRFGHPTAFATGDLLNWQPNPEFVTNLNDLEKLTDPSSWFPPAVQWKSVKPILFPFGNLTMWGLGLPLGILTLISLAYTIHLFLNFLFSAYRKDTPGIQYPISNILIVLWILGLFLYQGVQAATTMRYFLPIYPFIALVSGVLITNYLMPKLKLGNKFIGICLHVSIYVLLLVYPISFLSIYSRPITRVSASEWMYNNIPSGSTILNEEWDDALPIGNPVYVVGRNVNYVGKSVFMYDEDTHEKWERIRPVINQADYYITSSNRAYGALMRLPKRNPETIKFYQDMFNGTGDFYKVAEFTSRPCFPPLGDKHLFCFNDDNADEGFTVIDHPKVMIFKRR